MHINIKTILILAFLVCVEAYAGFFLEPEVHYWNGRVEKQQRSVLKWESITHGETVLHNTKLRTFAESQIQLKYSPEWFFIVGPNSSVDYLFSRGESDQIHQVSFSLQHGETFFSLPQCLSCQKTRFSWNLGDYFVKGESAEVLLQNSPDEKFIFLYEGSIQLSLEGKQYLLKAPVFVDLRSKTPLILHKKLPKHNYDLWIPPIVEQQSLNNHPSRRKALASHILVSDAASKVNWDIKKLFESWTSHYMTDKTVLHQNIQNINEVQTIEPKFKSLLSIDVSEFDLQSSASNWIFNVKIAAKITNIQSQIIEDQWTFERVYKGVGEEGSDLRLLKFLPLNFKNKKFDKPFLKGFWEDFQSESLMRGIDPLYDVNGKGDNEIDVMSW